MKNNYLVFGLATAMFFAASCSKPDNSASTANQPGVANNQDNGNAGNNPPANTPMAGAPEPMRPLVVPAGTVLPVILTTTLNSRTNSPGDEFTGSIAAPVLVDGEVAIPKDAIVTGAVVNAKAQGAIKGRAVMSLRLNQIKVHGKTYSISSRSFTETEKGKGKRSAIMTGGGAVAGALIGGLAGGGKGAAIGAGVGGGGGLAASAGTGGKNVTLPAESRINFKLTDSLTIDR
jgi:hypothetical protein